jgi:hypothetical protein
VLGAKTIELIHQNTHLDTVRDDIETLVMDAEVLESVIGAPDPEKKGKTLKIKNLDRPTTHPDRPRPPQDEPPTASAADPPDGSCTPCPLEKLFYPETFWGIHAPARSRPLNLPYPAQASPNS